MPCPSDRRDSARAAGTQDHHSAGHQNYGQTSRKTLNVLARRSRASATSVPVRLAGRISLPCSGSREVTVLRTTPPYRADHVGSLLRPPRLLAAREQHAAGRISADQLGAVEDDAIAEVVAMQEDVGLQSATDGEFRRSSWHMDYIYQLGGVSRGQEQLKVRFRNQDGTLEFLSAALRIDGKIRLRHTIFGDDFTELQGLVQRATPKLPIPSPSMC